MPRMHRLEPGGCCRALRARLDALYARQWGDSCTKNICGSKNRDDRSYGLFDLPLIIHAHERLCSFPMEKNNPAWQKARFA